MRKYPKAGVTLYLGCVPGSESRSGSQSSCRPATERCRLSANHQGGWRPCHLSPRCDCVPPCSGARPAWAELACGCWREQPGGRWVHPVPAFITTSAFNKERTRQSTSPQWSTDTEDSGYCMEFKTESLTHHCALENRPLTRWMQYLREGYTVCVDCQPPAMNSVSLRCSGDGLDSDGNQTLHWQAIGNPRCQGTWKKVRRVDQCSCPAVHSFIFI
ncbi:somatomedin-B and thrombospondin type-1 domain-containing protein isoform X2 [Acinonyx jubatus]|uniref:Somatomedin-B and thrombospondin type-1 domain-containing protein isoform X2 n=1 Tax=Acinonyx jubatus TaxID=32536 RepID=A0ABM3NXY3_ACIJB|nr:somatomedin-B and thrombospondin type-1 domain-containing protein isoform X2 [Acinonyx jubatus]